MHYKLCINKGAKLRKKVEFKRKKASLSSLYVFNSLSFGVDNHKSYGDYGYNDAKNNVGC